MQAIGAAAYQQAGPEMGGAPGGGPAPEDDPDATRDLNNDDDVVEGEFKESDE